MILKVKSFRTPSGKRKQRGRNDMARLIPEAKEEAQKLEQARNQMARTNLNLSGRQ
jgi:hypothetical protein